MAPRPLVAWLVASTVFVTTNAGAQLVPDACGSSTTAIGGLWDSYFDGDYTTVISATRSVDVEGLPEECQVHVLDLRARALVLADRGDEARNAIREILNMRPGWVPPQVLRDATEAVQNETLLRASESFVSVSGVETPETLTLFSPPETAVTWHVEVGAPWLVVEPGTGTTSGGRARVTLSIDPRYHDLAMGMDQTQIVFFAEGADEVVVQVAWTRSARRGKSRPFWRSPLGLTSIGAAAVAGALCASGTVLCEDDETDPPPIDCGSDPTGPDCAPIGGDFPPPPPRLGLFRISFRY